MPVTGKVQEDHGKVRAFCVPLYYGNILSKYIQVNPVFLMEVTHLRTGRGISKGCEGTEGGRRAPPPH